MDTEQNALKVDAGIIAVALEVYSQFIEEQNGDPDLYKRVLELMNEWRQKQ